MGYKLKQWGYDDICHLLHINFHSFKSLFLFNMDNFTCKYSYQPWWEDSSWSSIHPAMNPDVIQKYLDGQLNNWKHAQCNMWFTCCSNIALNEWEGKFLLLLLADLISCHYCATGFTQKFCYICVNGVSHLVSSLSLGFDASEYEIFSLWVGMAANCSSKALLIDCN